MKKTKSFANVVPGLAGGRSIKMISKSALVCTLLALSTHSFAASSTFFVVAHQDDWQLFMGADAYADTNSPDHKTIFIYTTAGDAGYGTGPGEGTGNNPYYAAREEGANRAVRFMANTASKGEAGVESTVTINGKSLQKYTYKNTTSYFLRLPDGSGHGTGYPGTGYQSLTRLHSGEIRAITAVNHSATYHGWTDLANTIQSIITTEGKGSPKIAVNFHDMDTALNPGEHPDHLSTAQAAEDAIQALPCVNRGMFVAYATNTKPINLPSEAASLRNIVNDAATWGATVSGLGDLGHYSTYDAEHNSWIGKLYSRTIPGTGNCAF